MVVWKITCDDVTVARVTGETHEAMVRAFTAAGWSRPGSCQDAPIGNEPVVFTDAVKRRWMAIEDVDVVPVDQWITPTLRWRLASLRVPCAMGPMPAPCADLAADAPALAELVRYRRAMADQAELRAAALRREAFLATED